jgi:hypothetical protein
MLVILATQDAEIRRVMAGSQFGKNESETLCQK